APQPPHGQPQPVSEQSPLSDGRGRVGLDIAALDQAPRPAGAGPRARYPAGQASRRPHGRDVARRRPTSAPRFAGSGRAKGKHAELTGQPVISPGRRTLVSVSDSQEDGPCPRRRPEPIERSRLGRDTVGELIPPNEPGIRAIKYGLA